MILVNNTLVQGQHDFYKRAGITLSEENNEEQNPETPKNPVLNPEPNPDPNPGETTGPDGQK